MLDERTDENENQVVFLFVCLFFYDILGNSPIGQMDLNNHGSCLELQLYDLVKKKKNKKQPSTFLESKKKLLKSPSREKGLDYKLFYMSTHKERNVNRVSPLKIKWSSYLSEIFKS